MRKFLLKGKQLLSKKLQQFDIEPVSIDYVGQQTPSRLKQSLSVLRQSQIDLQDNQDYQTYFKNYPNHHISHYLMNKLKDIDANILKSYNVPNNKNNAFVPVFDQKLQTKALAFKNAIEQYQEGYTKVQNPLVCICVVHFHHKRGTQIEYKYPNQPIISKISQQIIHHAMPDSSHLRDQDCNFFNFQTDCFGKKQMMFGVSYFKQIKVTEQMKKNNSQITRSHVQKAISIVSRLPLFQYLKIKLLNTTEIFFEDYTNFQIIRLAYQNINSNLIQNWERVQLPDLYMGCDLKKIINTVGVSNLYEIWKGLVYEKRVVIFAQTSSDSSSFILSLLSLFPGLNCFGIYSKSISKYMQSLRQYALPLRNFSSKNFLSISFHVQDFWQLSRFIKNQEGNFLLGTTNKLLKQSNQYGIQMLVNLQDGTIIKNKSRRQWQPLTKKQKNFISSLKDILQGESDNANINEIIRLKFHQFLRQTLLQFISGIKQYQIFMQQCQKYQKIAKKGEKSQVKKNHSYQLMEDEDENQKDSQNSNQNSEYAPSFPSQTQKIILPQLLLNKSFSYFRQFHNSNLPEIISGKLVPSIQVSDYDYNFRLDSNQFISYNWLLKKLVFGKGSLKEKDCKQIIFKSNQNLQIAKEENKQLTKSIYIGLINQGKYMKHGFYIDQSQNYQGQFQDGLKHGYGKFYKANQKYIGNFCKNLYEGQGQLVKNGQVYAGSFKQGLKYGFGSLQGTNSMSGYWINDQFISQKQNTMLQVQKDRKSSRKKSQSQNKKR